MSNQKIRCAIYTRKSTEEGLDSDFNTLDAQREAAEAYIASQKAEGWVCLADRYDDGGFSGGDMERPALERLLSDVASGRIDCIVVYKVDRLSRSLLDFARIMERLEEQEVSFVSVTQQFNTTHSMGRLTLNILLSFAQFEREIIAERTSDKMTAARRKGKWTGGMLVLGYDLHPDGGRITVNEEEAALVRGIFELYLQKESLLTTLKELKRRGWQTKEWVTQKGKLRRGKPFNKNRLYRLLTNPIYLGKVRCKEELYDGEHEPIVDDSVWRRVQALMHRNSRTGGRHVRNKYGALLKGLIQCGACGVTMAHSYTQKKSGRRYRYYICSRAQKNGYDSCPSPSVSAPEIEGFVIDQMRRIGKDPALIGETLAAAKEQSMEGLEQLEAERRSLEKRLKTYEDEVRGLIRLTAENGDGTALATKHLAELQELIRRTERRATEVREEAIALSRRSVDEREVAEALSLFDPVWDSLSPRERARALHLLLEQVVYYGQEGKVTITFRPTGMKVLAEGGDSAKG